MSDQPDDAIATPSPEPTLRHVLKLVDRVFQAELRQRLAVHGVTEAGYRALFVLRRVAGLSSAELARQNGVTAQASNQTLKTLLDDGLVERTPSPTHGRVLEIQLTERGRAVIMRCEDEAEDLERTMCAAMDTSQRHELEQLLRSCAAGLGHPVVDPAAPTARLDPALGRPA